MSSVMSTSVRGLMAAGRAIATTSHNIANTNTEGYSRQRVLTGTAPAGQVGTHYIGTGVVISGIDRIHNQIVEQQLQTNATELNRLSSYSELAVQLDTLVFEDTAGINQAQIEFFSALENSANYPQGMGQEEVVLAAGKHLANTFNALDRQLEHIQTSINQATASSVVEMNGISEAIYDVNKEITGALAYSQGDPPNDLLDHRDKLLQKLSAFTKIDTFVREDGGLDVSIGNGTPLVSGTEIFKLITMPLQSDPENSGVGIVLGGNDVSLDHVLSGGSLGGTHEFVGEVLNPLRAELGRMASALASTFNKTYTDLTGLPDSEFFKLPAIVAHSSDDNSGNAVVEAEIVDSSALTISDYKVSFDGSEYKVTRLSDNQQVIGAGDLTMDGIRFSMTAGAVAGDSYVIRPMIGAASNLQVAITDPRDLMLTITDTAGGISGIGGELAAVQGKDLFGAHTSLVEKYASLTVNIGSIASLSELQLNSMQQVWQKTLERHDGVSGVNLDEEAANLVMYQQAYEASARVISVAGGLFDTLIGTLNRL